MKIRTKRNLLIIAWFVIGLPLLFLAVEVSNLFLIPIFGLAIFVSSYTFTLRCPECKKPVSENPVNVFGKEIWMYTPWIPYLCSKCGHRIE